MNGQHQPICMASFLLENITSMFSINVACITHHAIDWVETSVEGNVSSVNKYKM
jgi:hypothetical protein